VELIIKVLFLFTSTVPVIPTATMNTTIGSGIHIDMELKIAPTGMIKNHKKSVYFQNLGKETENQAIFTVYQLIFDSNFKY
jgi:hypothetical protein